MTWLDSADLVAGFFWGMWITRHYYQPVVTIKVTKMAPEEEVRSTGWKECVQPICAKLRVAQHFGSGIVFNTIGAGAIANLLDDMASKLDYAVERKWAEKPGPKDGQPAAMEPGNLTVRVVDNG